MNLYDYQTQVARTANYTLTPRDQLANYSLGLAGEVGEVLEPIKKHLYHGRALDLDALHAELGDVLWYLAALAAALGTNLAQVAADNAAKLQRRYPEGFVHANVSLEV